MGTLGWQELVIVLVIVIIIFGAGKLTDVGGALGKSMKDFKAATTEDDTDKTAETPTRPLADRGTSPGRQVGDEVLVGSADRRDEEFVYAGDRPANRGNRADEI